MVSMKKFNEFYIKYLGAHRELMDAGQQIFPSITRVEPEAVNSNYYHHLIVTQYMGKLVHSVAPSLLPDYREVAPLDVTEDLLERVDDAFVSIYRGRYYRIREMHRYTTETHFEPSPLVTVLSEEHREIVMRRLGKRGTAVKERYWQNTMRQMLRDGRFFSVIQGNTEIARSNVVDIPYSAANIDIWTHPDHRHKGLATALVGAAVNWCHRNDRVPVYIAHACNEPSVSLAEKMELTRMATEIQTFVVRY